MRGDMLHDPATQLAHKMSPGTTSWGEIAAKSWQHSQTHLHARLKCPEIPGRCRKGKELVPRAVRINSKLPFCSVRYTSTTHYRLKNSKTPFPLETFVMSSPALQMSFSSSKNGRTPKQLKQAHALGGFLTHGSDAIASSTPDLRAQLAFTQDQLAQEVKRETQTLQAQLTFQHQSKQRTAALGAQPASAQYALAASLTELSREMAAVNIPGWGMGGVWDGRWDEEMG